ncbi:hypothetical protein K7432_013480, partial [Basidiobolus ranarum]
SRLAFSENRFLNEQQSSFSEEAIKPVKSLPWKSKFHSQDQKSTSTEIIREIPDNENRAEPSSASKSLRARITPSNSQLSTILTAKKDEVVPDSQLGRSSMDEEDGTGSVMMLQVDDKLASRWNLKETLHNPKNTKKEDTKKVTTNTSLNFSKDEDSDLSPSLQLLMEECDHGEILSPIKRVMQGDKLDVLLAEISSGFDSWNEEEKEIASIENPENPEPLRDAKYDDMTLTEAAFFADYPDINSPRDNAQMNSLVNDTREENDEGMFHKNLHALKFNELITILTIMSAQNMLKM